MISLDVWYQNNKGASLSADGVEANRGQCVQAMDFVLNQVFGLPYHYGNAIDWFNSPGELLNNFRKINYSPGLYPLKGDFVIFNSGVGSKFGHIDACAADGNPVNYTGYDSNWGGDKTVHAVAHNYAYVVGFLRYNGGNMKPDPNQINQLVVFCWGPGAATPADIAKLNGQNTLQDAMNLILSDGRTAVWDKQVYALKTIQASGGTTVNKQSALDYITNHLQ